MSRPSDDMNSRKARTESDAAVDSIARSIASVVLSASTQGMTEECMRLMGARDKKELADSLKGAVAAALGKSSTANVSPRTGNDGEDEANACVLADRMLNGRRVYPRCSLDKLLDSMVDDLISNADNSC